MFRRDLMALHPIVQVNISRHLTGPVSVTPSIMGSTALRVWGQMLRFESPNDHKSCELAVFLARFSCFR